MAGPIRIAHLIHRLDYGGLENGLVNLINRLPADRFSHTVIALTEITPFSERLRSGVETFALRKPPGAGMAYLASLYEFLRAGRFDILHTRNLPCLEGQFAGCLARVPYRIHGEHGWDIFDLDGSRLAYRLLRRASRLVVHRYVMLSAQLSEYWQRRIGVPATRIRQLCNGVDTEKFRPLGTDSLPPDWPWPDRGFVIGTVGRIEAVKDFAGLVSAFALLRETARNAARLVIVGEGSLLGDLRRQVHQLGLADQVWLAGARDDVPALMSAFDVFVLPSLAEGISNTILEAMACGTAVIATDVGGNRELVVEAETGFLVPASEPPALATRLGDYLADPECLARHARAGRQRAVEKFSIDAMVAGYQQLYLDRPGRPGSG